MPAATRRAFLAHLGAAAILAPPAATRADAEAGRRRVLVELYTSQGCDMCPAAERILGELAEDQPTVVPVAFHVDYFNKPWRDPFSDPIYSDRQATYDRIYAKPKPAEYGLYYTPMVMVDGRQSVNGRDPAAIRAAVRAAASRPAAVGLSLDWQPGADRRAGTAAIRVAVRDRAIEGQSLLVCGVVREDKVGTDVPAGENKGKTLIARHPARQTRFQAVRVAGSATIPVKLEFKADPLWDLDRLRLAVFVQDQKSGAVHQALDRPWPTPERSQP